MQRLLLAKPVLRSILLTATSVPSAAPTKNPANAAVAIPEVHGSTTAVNLEIPILTTRGLKADRLVKVTHTSRVAVFILKPGRRKTIWV